MISLEDAVEAAEERKAAALGEATTTHITFADDFNQRAIFTGFEIDPTELADIASRAGEFFHGLCGQMGLQPVFASAWIDGLLIGLMAARQLQAIEHVAD